MKTASFAFRALGFVASLTAFSSALSISEINGPKYLSPYAGQIVKDVTGVVTAKGPDGLWLRALKRDRDDRTSESVYVFDRAFGTNLTVGDAVWIEGTVSEYRSNKDHLFLTEITKPLLVRKMSGGNPVQPLIIGDDTRKPPREQFSSLDGGDVFAVPNNKSLVSVENPTLDPKKYGMDFWESLCGELVTVKKPTALSKPNNYGDTWVVGDWKVSGRNGRQGLTITHQGK